METIAGGPLDEHFDVPLDALFNYKSSGDKDIENLSPDWTFLDDLDSERYLQSPLGVGDILPLECVGMDDIQESVLLGNLGGDDDGVGGIIMDTKISGDRTRSPSSCKSCTSDTDSQYDSGIGESLSGEDSESLSISGGLSPDVSNKPLQSAAVDRIHASVSSDETAVCVKVDATEIREDSGDGSAKTRASSRRYNLRTSSVVNRIETEHKTKQSPRKAKPKNRPPPLSKYRRKTANARERSRMTEINEAFDDLQNVIPELPEGKLTKMTTLKLAMDYITALRKLLASGEQGEGEGHGTDSSGSLDHREQGEGHGTGNSRSLDHSQAEPVTAEQL